MIEPRRADVKLRDLVERYGISESSVKRVARRASIAGEAEFISITGSELA